MPVWTKEEIQYLVDNCQERYIKEMAEELGRTYKSVQNKLMDLQLIGKCRKHDPRKPKTGWSEQDTQFILDNYPKMDAYELADALGKTENAVRNKLMRLGVFERKVKRQEWTEEELDFLELNYSTKGASYIARKLGRTTRSVKHKANRLKVKAYDDDFITQKQLAEMFGQSSKVTNRWIRKCGLPCKAVSHNRKRNKKSISYNIDPEDFWKWAEKHKDIINWSHYELGSLVPEPLWVVSAKLDDKHPVNHKRSFRISEIRKIISEHRNGRKIASIADDFGRTVDSIKHVIKDHKDIIT